MRALIAGAAILLLAACGGGDGDELSGETSTQLQGHVDLIEAAAIGLDADTAYAELGALRAAVDALVAEGEIPESRAEELYARIAAVESALSTITTTTTTTTTTTAPPPPPPPPPAPDDEDDDDDDEGDGFDWEDWEKELKEWEKLLERLGLDPPGRGNGGEG